MARKDAEARKEYQRKWRQKNAEAKKEYDRKWYHANKEYYRKWLRDNPEAKKEYDRKYYQANKEARNEYQRKYYQENPDKFNARNARRRASKIQRTPHWLTEDEHWLIKEAYTLAKLREKVTGIKWDVDHLVPLQGDIVSGLHVPWNLQVIPESENRSKHNKWNWDEQR